MALVTCSECGRSVSERAKACPFCGNPDLPRSESTSSPGDHQCVRGNLPPPPPPPPPPPSAQKVLAKPKKNKNGCMPVIVFLIAVAVIWTIFLALFGDKYSHKGHADQSGPVKVDSSPVLDSIDWAEYVCKVVDSTGQSSEPCDIDVPNINIHAAIGADEARVACNVLSETLRKKGAKFESYWRIRFISPYSGGSPVATCSPPN